MSTVVKNTVQFVEVPREAISTLSEDSCCVCLELLKDKVSVLAHKGLATNYDHPICEPCLTQWAITEHHRNCPGCRAPVDEISGEKIEANAPPEQRVHEQQPVPKILKVAKYAIFLELLGIVAGALCYGIPMLDVSLTVSVSIMVYSAIALLFTVIFALGARGMYNHSHI